MHSWGEAWVLDGGCHGRVDDHNVYALHAAEVIWGYEPTELCLLQRICCESCFATEILLYSALLPP